jgi:hypothetical protein
MRCTEMHISNSDDGRICFRQSMNHANVKKLAHVFWPQCVRIERWRGRYKSFHRLMWYFLGCMSVATSATDKDMVLNLLKTPEDFVKTRVGSILPAFRCTWPLKLRVCAVGRQPTRRSASPEESPS